MRTLSIDLGNKRIGLAISDEGGKFATPLDVLQVSDPSLAIDPIVAITQKEAVQQVLLGLPLNMDDTVGPAARKVVAWAKLFKTRCAVPIIFVDERLSSFQAEQDLTHRKRGGEKITRGQKKARLDALAAAGFLQEFLDGKLQPISIG